MRVNAEQSHTDWLTRKEEDVSEHTQTHTEERGKRAGQIKRSL
jgi:hypothetical protein